MAGASMPPDRRRISGVLPIAAASGGSGLFSSAHGDGAHRAGEFGVRHFTEQHRPACPTCLRATLRSSDICSGRSMMRAVSRRSLVSTAMRPSGIRQSRRDLCRQDDGVAEELGDHPVCWAADRARAARRPARTRPSRITATWSAKDSASAWSWVTRMVVMPAASSSSATALRMRGAQAGVERRERLVEQHQPRLRASARASATRCCWPPDSSCGRRSRIAVSSSTHVHQLGDALARAGPRRASRPKPILSATLRCGNSAPSCATKPMPRRCAGTAVGAVGQHLRRRARCGRRPAPRSRR